MAVYVQYAVRQKGKREAGESPARARHCEGGVQRKARVAVTAREGGKAALHGEAQVRKPAGHWYRDCRFQTTSHWSYRRTAGAAAPAVFVVPSALLQRALSLPVPPTVTLRPEGERMKEDIP
jgi:hypothetical protein